MSISGYRRLLRSIGDAFKGDNFAIKNAKNKLKLEFLKNKTVVDVHELKELLTGVDEVDEMLRFNIVQGKLNEKGNFGKIIYTLTNYFIDL